MVTALALVALALAFVATRIPGCVDGPYALHVSTAIVGAMATLSGALPFCLAEFVLAALIARGAWHVVRGAIALVRRPTTVVALLVTGAARTLRWAAVIGAVFYGTWGLNYARAPLVDLLGWQDHVTPLPERAEQARELGALAEAAVDACNSAYREAMGSDDLGVPSAWSLPWAELDRATDVALDRAIDDLALPAAMRGRHGRTKVPLASGLMSRMHLTGFFFPWTGEANLNGDQPHCHRPHVVAHEKAHQRGIGPEDEVEFLAFAAGVRGEYAYQRYAAYLMASETLLHELMRVGGMEATRLANARLPGVRRDLQARSAFWSAREGTLTRITITINDTYLKSHGVAKGVEAYGASTALLIAYARTRGGLVGGR